MLVGRSDCSIIKTHILFFPPLYFSKISFFFWTSSLPPKNKITNANTNTKDNFLTTNKKTDKMTSHFSLGSWLQIWRLVGHFSKCANVQMCNVQLWRHDIFLQCLFNMTFFLQCLFSIAMAKIFSCKVDNAFFPVAMTKYFPLPSLMCHGARWALNINIDLLLRRCGN